MIAIKISHLILCLWMIFTFACVFWTTNLSKHKGDYSFGLEKIVPFLLWLFGSMFALIIWLIVR